MELSGSLGKSRKSLDPGALEWLWNSTVLMEIPAFSWKNCPEMLKKRSLWRQSRFQEKWKPEAPVARDLEGCPWSSDNTFSITWDSPGFWHGEWFLKFWFFHCLDVSCIKPHHFSVEFGIWDLIWGKTLCENLFFRRNLEKSCSGYWIQVSD